MSLEDFKLEINMHYILIIICGHLIKQINLRGAGHAPLLNADQRHEASVGHCSFPTEGTISIQPPSQQYCYLCPDGTEPHLNESNALYIFLSGIANIADDLTACVPPPLTEM